MKKVKLAILLLFICTLTFDGCKSDLRKTDNNTNTGNKIKIRWLGQWYGEGNKETLVREIAREFAFLNQEYEVELQFPHEMAKKDASASAFSVTPDTIKKMIRDNVWPYDLMLCDSYIYQNIVDSIGDPYWGEKYLVDFKNEAWFKKAHKESIFKSGRAFAAFGGIAPGVFIEGIWNVLYVSSVVEEKLGIKVKRSDMTIQDYKEYAKAVYDYNQTHSDKITFLWQVRPDKIFDHIVMSALGKESASDKNEAYATLEKVYAALAEFKAYEPTKQHIVSTSEYDLDEQRALFIYNSSWITPIWHGRNAEGEKRMHSCELPSFNNSKAPAYSGVYNAVFVVPKNAKNRDAAIKLMQFIGSPEIAEKWVKYSKCPTGLEYRVVYADFNTDEINLFSQQIKKKYNDYLVEPNLNSVLFNSKTNINYYGYQVMDGSMSPQEAIRRVKQQN